MFSLSFVGGPNPRRGSKSASVFGPGGSISASGFGPGGPYLLADLDRGVQIRWDTGLYRMEGLRVFLQNPSFSTDCYP